MKIGITGVSGILGAALVGRFSKSYKIFETSRSKGLEGRDASAIIDVDLAMALHFKTTKVISDYLVNA